MTYQIAQLNERTSKGVNNESTQTHDYLILKAMQAQCFTPAEIADHVQLTGRYTTKDPLITSVKWHLNKLTKEGIIVKVDNPTEVIDAPVVKPAKVKKVKVNLETAAA